MDELMATDVAVLLPAYNEEEWIGGAIDSVLAQTHEALTLVVVDDGSVDATARIVNDYEDPRVCYIKQENRGHAGALNRGLNESDAEYYAFVDADDRWNAEKLERQISLLESTDASAVHSNATYIDADGEVIGQHHETPPPDPSDRQTEVRALYLNNFVCTSSFVCHRSAIEDERFDEDLYANSDHDMWLRIAGEHRFGYVGEPLLRYRFHGGNISKNYQRLFEDRKTVAARGAARYPYLEDVADRKLSNVHLTYGINLVLDGHTQEGRRALKTAIRHDPSNWRAIATYLLSFVDAGIIESRSKAGRHYD